MKVIDKTICNKCGKIYNGTYGQIEVCGNCGNETSFTVITTVVVTEDDE